MSPGNHQMIDTDGCQRKGLISNLTPTIHLHKFPLGFGNQLKAWLLDFGQEDEILNVLRDAEKQATMRLKIKID